MWGECAPTGCRLLGRAGGGRRRRRELLPRLSAEGGRAGWAQAGQPGAGSGSVLGGHGVRHTSEANLIVLAVGLRTSDSEKSPLLRDWWRLSRHSCCLYMLSPVSRSQLTRYCLSVRPNRSGFTAWLCLQGQRYLAAVWTKAGSEDELGLQAGSKKAGYAGLGQRSGSFHWLSRRSGS